MDARVKPEHDERGAMLGLDPSMTNGGAMLGLDPSMAARARRTEVTARRLTDGRSKYHPALTQKKPARTPAFLMLDWPN
jgi:hypothetical protein